MYKITGEEDEWEAKGPKNSEEHPRLKGRGGGDCMTDREGYHQRRSERTPKRTRGKPEEVAEFLPAGESTQGGTFTQASIHGSLSFTLVCQDPAGVLELLAPRHSFCCWTARAGEYICSPQQAAWANQVSQKLFNCPTPSLTTCLPIHLPSPAPQAVNLGTYSKGRVLGLSFSDYGFHSDIQIPTYVETLSLASCPGPNTHQLPV